MDSPLTVQISFCCMYYYSYKPKRGKDEPYSIKQNNKEGYCWNNTQILRWPIGAKHNAIPVKKHNNLFQNTTIFTRTKYNLTERNNLLQNRTIFPRTQQSFREQNTIWQNTTIFLKTRHNLIEHKRKLIHNKINWNTKAFHKTQQNFKVLLTSFASSEGRVQVTWFLSRFFWKKDGVLYYQGAFHST